MLNSDPFSPPDPSAVDDYQAEQERQAEQARIEQEAKETADRRRAELVAFLEYNWVWIAGLATIAVGVFSIWFFGFRTTPSAVTVISKSWERTIEVEQYIVDSESSWRRPNNRGTGEGEAFDVYSRWEYRDSTCWDYDEAGYCTWEVDNYDDRWYWSTHVWDGTGDHVSASAVTSSPPYREPYWPDLPGENRFNQVGNVRLSDDRGEWYKIVVVDADNQVTTVELPESEWQAVGVGDELVAHFSGRGSIRGVDPIG